jgi:hypothetical protein
MRSIPWMITVSFLLGSTLHAWAEEGKGLVAPASSKLWPTWHGRLSVGLTEPVWRTDFTPQGQGLKVSGVGLLGDYYFAPSRINGHQDGGFRATSGLIIGTRSPSLLSGTGSALSAPAEGRSFSSEQRPLGLQPQPGHLGSAGSDTTGAAPYLGLGYSSFSGRGGWGFSADIGVVAFKPSSTVKLGGVSSNSQNLEDMLRDMRLSPLMYLSVSYSF